MKGILTIFTLLAITTICFSQPQHYYQLKIFTLETEEQEQRIDSYLEDAYLPALSSQGIIDIGVFKLRSESSIDSVQKIYVLIPYLSLFQFETMEAQLSRDEVYKEAAKDYLNATYDNPTFLRQENIIMKAFANMPQLKPSPLDGARKDRIYELRSYESASDEIYKNKMDMFNGGGEIALFEELEFNAVFYGEVIAGPSMPNLMYMTTHANQTVRDNNWKAFVDSEGWKTMSSLPKYQNNVSHIDILFLYPTDYSEY